MNWFKEVIEPSPQYKGAGINGKEAIGLLYPPFRDKLEALVRNVNAEQAVKDAGVEFDIFETIRTDLRQAWLFENGKTKLKEAGTHKYGVAADVVPKVRGQWTWSVPQGIWMLLGKHAKLLGLVWGGDWKTIVDCPHIQFIPVSQQAMIAAGNYPDYKMDAPTSSELDARKAIVSLLGKLYPVAHVASLSEDTMRLLNQFRFSPELKDIRNA